MRKRDVTMHGEHDCYYPAINVKVYGMEWDSDTVAEHFKCDKATAEQAARYSFETSQYQFWEEAQEYAKDIFGNIKVYAGGRSGGWLEVDGLPDVETWDAVMLGKWSKFCNGIKQSIEYHTSWESNREQIESNKWAMEGAERYNFIDRDGHIECIAELKQKAIDAGFGPVVR